MKKRYFVLVGLALFATSMCWAIEPEQANWDINTYPFWGSDQSLAVQSGRMIWGDFNNDGFKDVFCVGGVGNNGYAFLYKNNGDGTFTRVQEDAFTPLSDASAEFIDYNNDGNLDLVVIGKKSDGTKTAIVYENQGAAGDYAFVENEDRSAELVAAATDKDGDVGRKIQAVDYDLDGWTDLVISASRQSPVNGDWAITRIFKNVNGHFEMQTGNVTGTEDDGNFYELRAGSIHVGDVNNDGYADIVNVGYRDIPSGGYFAYLYINNGDGTFTKSDLALTGNEQVETIFADINSDGYADIIEIASGQCNLYINNKDLTFTKISSTDNTNLQNLTTSSVSVTAGDINNDGFLDLFITGASNSIAPGRMFYNNGDTTFTMSAAFNGGNGEMARSGSNNLVDINGDGNLDYSCFGYAGGGYRHAIGINNLEGTSIPTNAAPSVPDNFNVNYSDGKFTLTWDKSTDAETPQSALRYNIYVKNKDTNAIYAYAPVDTETGVLKIGGAIVPLLTTNSIELSLENGNYMFGVQAVDQADLASIFTTIDYKMTGISVVNAQGAVRAFVSDKAIVIENTLSTAAPYSVVTLSGQIIAAGVCPAGTQQTVSGLVQGVYIVKTTGTVAKLLVF